LIRINPARPLRATRSFQLPDPITKDEQAQVPGAQAQIGRAAPAPTSRAQHRLWGGVVAAVIGGLLLAAAAGTWRPPWPSNSRPAPRLSIVVLPFANLGGDPEQQYFADGITEDVTTDLSRIVDMFVISRNTAFTYRNKLIDTKQIGRELGVRYVLDGSVQRSGNQVRINTQLINAESDARLWAARFERERADLFALQNEITGQIAYALGLELIAAERAKPTDNPDAMDFILRGRALQARPPAREMFAEMISQYERAVELDPHSVVAKSYLTTALMGRVLNGMADSAATDIKRAEELVSEALAASPRNPLAHLARGFLLFAKNRVEEAIPEYETALASNRNWALVIATLGGSNSWPGCWTIRSRLRSKPSASALAIPLSEFGISELGRCCDRALTRPIPPATRMRCWRRPSGRISSNRRRSRV
jgi:TolB-like protein